MSVCVGFLRIELVLLFFNAEDAEAQRIAEKINSDKLLAQLVTLSAILCASVSSAIKKSNPDRGKQTVRGNKSG